MINLVLFILLVLVLFYLALIYTSSSMALLAIMAASFAVCSLFWLVYIRCTVRGKVTVPIGVADYGKKITVCITLSNRGIFSCSKMKLCLLVEDRFSGHRSKKWIYVSEILTGESKVEYQVLLPQAGSYEISFHKCKVFEPTGLFSVGVRCRSRAGVQILPQPQAIVVRLTESVRNFFGDSDVYDDKQAGNDTSELFQVRPFVDGDKLQSIHWKLSAKTDELMVKENSLPKACPVVLFLDYDGRKKIDTFESFLKIASSLSFSLMDEGCPHYIAWYEEQTQDITRIRVDNEEGYYLFLSYFLQAPTECEHEPLRELYREKYRAQHYLYGFFLDETLRLYQGEQLCADFARKEVEQVLGGLELVL